MDFESDAELDFEDWPNERWNTLPEANIAPNHMGLEEFCVGKAYLVGPGRCYIDFGECIGKHVILAIIALVYLAAGIFPLHVGLQAT